MDGHTGLEGPLHLPLPEHSKGQYLVIILITPTTNEVVGGPGGHVHRRFAFSGMYGTQGDLCGQF